MLARVGGELCEYPQTAPLHGQLQLSVYVGGDSRGGEVGGPLREERERMTQGQLMLEEWCGHCACVCVCLCVCVCVCVVLLHCPRSLD